jgi:RNA polymerase sigma-70 factor (ECF subfamily)
MSDDNRQRFRHLLREVQAGSETAAQELYDTYISHVLRCVRHRLFHKMRSLYDSQDFTQQVWASFFRERHELPDFETPEDLTNYLIGMACNKVRMAGRYRYTQKRDIRLERLLREDAGETGLHPAGRDPTPSSMAVVRERFDQLTDQQPPVAREVTRLRVEGNTFEEIAEKLDMDESSARKILRQVRREAPPAEDDA